MTPESAIAPNPLAAWPQPQTDSRPYIAAGAILIALLVGGIGGWAALAPLSGAVIAPGVVAVETDQKVVQHLEGGIVREIFVREGAFVEAGALLVRLDDTMTKATVTMVAGRIDELEGRLARLRAERDDLAEIAFPDTLLSRRSDPKAAEIMAGQRAVFIARRSSRQGKRAVLESRIAQLEDQIRGLSAQQQSLERQLALIDDELEGLRTLHAKGYAPRTRILALERYAEQLHGQRGQHVADMARARNEIGEARLAMIQNDNDFLEGVQTQIRDVEAQIFELAQRRTAAAEQLKRTDIAAPQSGVILDLSVHTVGGVIAPGAPIMKIVPKDDHLVVRARVRPEDIDQVTAGQDALVRLVAFNQRTTPQLVGTVQNVSADRLVEEVTGTPYYLARIEIPESERARIQHARLLPGMPVEAFIQTGARTPLSYFLKPVTDGMARAFKED